MGVGRTTISIFKPWQSEFLNIWLFVAFAAYEWLQTVFILMKYKKFYDLPNDTDYMLIFLVTFGVAASMTTTAIYLAYYPISEKTK